MVGIRGRRNNRTLKLSAGDQRRLLVKHLHYLIGKYELEGHSVIAGDLMWAVCRLREKYPELREVG